MSDTAEGSRHLQEAAAPTGEPGCRASPLQGLRAFRASWRGQLSLIWVVTAREIRDTLRDWRLVVPIALLTLVFPVILNFAAVVTLNFVRQYKATALGEQAIPFMLLVVGFFPISFSLVIALETFVGEKERRSLEPLLATPLSNTQLYLGKMLAALIPPVLASYLGIAVYLASLYLNIDYRPSLTLVLQIVLLTTAEALVMVSGAVIVSSRTTSVRAANLLASFIILPMAFLVQGEALMMFWAKDELLWFVLLALLVIDVMLVRMGARIFNREELLGGQIDGLSLRRSWRLFKGYLLAPPGDCFPAARAADGGQNKWSLARFYRQDVPQLLKLNRAPLAVVLVGLAAAVSIGWLYAVRFPLPAGLISLEGITREAFDRFEGSSVLPTLSTWGILSHNIRSLLLAGVLAVVSFGAFAILLLMLPLALIGFATMQVAAAGYSPLLFMGAFFVPHGMVELPAAIIATAMAVRLGLAVVSPPPGMTVGQSWLQALAHFLKLFVLVVLPLLAAAAAIEVYLTPRLVVAIYGS